MSFDNSAIGTVAQLLFHARLKQHGIEPLFVSDGALPFDLGAWNPRTKKFFRVQVKSTKTDFKGTLWKVTSRTHNGKRGYTKEDTDIMAVYAAEDDRFFIFPVEDLHGSTGFMIPRKSRARPHRHDRYLENWLAFGE